MSTYYGRLKGNRGGVTRCGSASSGIRSSVETWQSCIHSQYGPSSVASGEHMGRIEVTDKHGNQTGLRFDIDADGLARFIKGGGVGGEYGGDDVETTATLDEIREDIDAGMRQMREAAEQINAALAREASL